MAETEVNLQITMGAITELAGLVNELNSEHVDFIRQLDEKIRILLTAIERMAISPSAAANAMKNLQDIQATLNKLREEIQRANAESSAKADSVKGIISTVKAKDARFLENMDKLTGEAKGQLYQTGDIKYTPQSTQSTIPVSQPTSGGTPPKRTPPKRSSDRYTGGWKSNRRNLRNRTRQNRRST